MGTTTSRLALPYPVGTDPANVPGDMGNLANGLDGGTEASWDGVVVGLFTPGVIGSLPTNPVEGTLYAVNSNPPYLLYYTGESGSGTSPSGWRIVGGPGSNVSYLSSAGPGNSANVGSQPVWAPLDHKHATPAWGIADDIRADAFGASAGSSGHIADAGHAHPYPVIPSGKIYLVNTISGAGSGFENIIGTTPSYLQGGMNTNGANGTLTLPEPGIYRIIASWFPGEPSPGGTWVYVTQNGIIQSSMEGSNGVVDLFCNADDAIGWGFQCYGGSVHVGPGALYTSLSASFISPPEGE